ncbi:hypothetical protein [Sphingomonas sp. CROZ-RG-20F-R02-07]|uniref:hypothetical protein n=1 Tax=Sphingomonas sp. CROZ-RG-20F-R02-07 TaxID=2914832 RepID=UPI001F5962FE|nr:hypothetical protein [Sphingomonas sp. CROZ-RG-20F-R02-07]
MIRGLITSHAAIALIAPYSIVAFANAASDTSVGPANGPGAPIAGTVGQIGASAPGVMVDVEKGGIPRVRLGGPVGAGDWLTSDANGAAVKVSAAGQRTIGQAQQPGVAGDIIDYLSAPGVDGGA